MTSSTTVSSGATLCCPYHGPLETHELGIMVRMECPCGYAIMYMGGRVRIIDPINDLMNLFNVD